MTRNRFSLFSVLALAGLGLFFQGCSLLFVAKGGTRYSDQVVPKAPEASSLSKRMNEPDVVLYPVQDGDTFDNIADRYYGKPAEGKRIARVNRLNFKGKLKTGMILRIVNPAYFPDPNDRPKKVIVRSPKVSKTPSLTPTPDTTVQPVAKITRPKVNNAFAPGEALKFEIRALSALAGYATLSVGDYMKLEGRPCLPLTARANSVFPFSTIFTVNDIQTSYFDTVDFISWKFENNVVEGNYKARNLEMYDQLKHKVSRKHNDEKPELKDVAPFTQDIISCFYYFRLLPLEEGKSYNIPTQSSGKNYQLIVNVVRREKITVPAGTFDCFYCKPLVKSDTVFRNNEDIDVWVTADCRHLPVKIKSGIVVGSIEVSLFKATLPTLKNADKGCCSCQ